MNDHKAKAFVVKAAMKAKYSAAQADDIDNGYPGRIYNAAEGWKELAGNLRMIGQWGSGFEKVGEIYLPRLKESATKLQALSSKVKTKKAKQSLRVAAQAANKAFTLASQYNRAEGSGDKDKMQKLAGSLAPLFGIMILRANEALEAIDPYTRYSVRS